MDFKRIFQIPILAWFVSVIFIFRSSCYLFKKVAPVYLTSAFNVNKRKGKNTQAITMRKTHIHHWREPYVFRNNANYFEWLFWEVVRSLNLNISYFEKDTFKSNWSGSAF
jgi:hypothetical protein